MLNIEGLTSASDIQHSSRVLSEFDINFLTFFLNLIVLACTQREK